MRRTAALPYRSRALPYRSRALPYRMRALPYRSNFYRKEREKVTHACGTVAPFGKNR